MAGYMAEVAKMLGVELGEEFTIVKRRNKEVPLFCSLREDGLHYWKNHNGYANDSFSYMILHRLLIGKEKIQKLHNEADAVEVVRCGECFYGRYHKDIEAIEDGKCICCDIHSSFVGKSDFCSYGERKVNKVNLEDIVDLDAQTEANNEAMQRVFDFMVGERRSDEKDS